MSSRCSITIHFLVQFVFLLGISVNSYAEHEAILPQIDSLKRRGDTFYEQRHFPEALISYTKALELSRNTNPNPYIGNILGSLGNIYAVFQDYERANFYFKQAYEIDLDEGDVANAFLFASNVITTACANGNTAEARRYLRLRSNIDLGKKHVAFKTFYDYYTRSKIAEAEKNNREAIKYKNLAIGHIYKHTGEIEHYFLIALYGELSSAYFADNQIQKSLETAQEFARLANATSDSYLLVSSFEMLAKAYKRAGMPDSCMKYQDLYLTHKDSVFNQSKYNHAVNYLFEYENRVVRDNLNTLQQTINTQTFYIVVSVCVIVFLLVLTAFVTFHYSKLRAIQRVLIRKNEQLMRIKEQSTRPREKQKIDDETGKAILEKINKVMDDESVICDESFSLNALSKIVGSNTTYVSHIINSQFEQSFASILQERRVQIACKRLADREQYAHLTIQAVAESVGYNSSSSFVKAFKRVVGMTPSVYQRLSRENS